MSLSMLLDPRRGVMEKGQHPTKGGSVSRSVCGLIFWYRSSYLPGTGMNVLNVCKDLHRDTGRAVRGWWVQGFAFLDDPLQPGVVHDRYVSACLIHADKLIY